MITFVFAMFLPWAIGYLLLRVLFAKQKGINVFLLGVGYVLGWFLVTCLLRVFDFLERPFEFVELLSIQGLLLIVLIWLSYQGRVRLFTLPKRADFAHSNCVLQCYVAGAILILLLSYRFGLTLTDLIVKPVFPWDGWGSWTAKAKIFYSMKSIPPLAESYIPFWRFSEPSMVSIGSARHPYFISLVSTYVGLAWGSWDEGVILLPWGLLMPALTLIVYGGLRKVGLSTLLALSAGYAVISLPMVDAHFSLGAYADVWVGTALLVAIFLLIFYLTEKSFSYLFGSVVFVAIAYLTKHASLIFSMVLPFVVLWFFIGTRLTIVAACVVFTSSFLFVYFFESVGTKALEFLLSSFAGDKLAYNPVFFEAGKQWFVIDNWHCIFTITSLSLVLIIFGLANKKQRDAACLLIVAGVMSMVMMLVLTFLSSKMSGQVFSSYFNRVTLHFIPIFTLIPFCAYYILSASFEGKNMMRVGNMGK